MGMQLTPNAVNDLMEGRHLDSAVLQILSTRKVSGANQSERYRVLISDGTHSNGHAMLGTHLNHLVTDDLLQDLSIVKVEKPVVNKVNNQGRAERRIIVLLDMKILVPGKEVGHKIGNPVLWVEGQTATKPQAAAPEINEIAPRADHRPAAANGDQSAADHGHVGTVFPIAALTPFQNRWTIKGRVTRKSDIRHYSNSKGEGKLFNVELLDSSGEIKATAFNQDVDRLYELFEVNKVYYISGCSIKAAWQAGNRSSVGGSQYELTFGTQSKITLCEGGDESDTPTIAFDFVPIRNLEQVPKDTLVDVIGVATETSEVTTIVARATGKELRKREVKLLDSSGADISLTLWAAEAEKFDGSAHPIIAAKKVKVGDFGGRTLSSISESRLLINPDIKQAHQLKGWYDTKGSGMTVQSLTTQRGGTGGAGINYGGGWKTLAEAKLEQLGSGDKPDYFTAKACITTIRTENALYMACSSPDCNRKVVDQQNGLYRCEKCNTETPNFKWRMLLNACLCDATDYVWATLFQESGELLLGCTSEELGKLKTSDETAFLEVFKKVNMAAFIFRLRVKMENYNDERKLKYTVYEVKNVDEEQYSKKLEQEIEQLAKELGEI